MQLVIRDLVFPIESATLQAGMWDPYWSNKWNGGRTPKPMLSLELQAAELEHGDTMWAPRLYNEWLPFPSQDWRDIANRTITWRTAVDAETREPNGSMYVFEHASIHEANLLFGARNGLEFDISWRGVCDIFWDQGDYGTRVPFAATANARFSNVLVHGSARDDAASFRDRFAAHLNSSDFEQGPVIVHGHAYEDGMKMTSCVFTPKG